MRAIPGFNLIHAPAVGLDGQDHLDCFRDGGADFEAVAVEKTVNQDRRGSFIAAEPRMVLYQAEAECGRLAHEVGPLVTGGMAGRARADSRSARSKMPQRVSPMRRINITHGWLYKFFTNLLSNTYTHGSSIIWLTIRLPKSPRRVRPGRRGGTSVRPR